MDCFTNIPYRESWLFYHCTWEKGHNIEFVSSNIKAKTSCKNFGGNPIQLYRHKWQLPSCEEQRNGVTVAYAHICLWKWITRKWGNAITYPLNLFSYPFIVLPYSCYRLTRPDINHRQQCGWLSFGNLAISNYHVDLITTRGSGHDMLPCCCVMVLMMSDKGPVMWTFDVFYVFGFNNLLNKQSVASGLRCNDAHVMSLQCEIETPGGLEHVRFSVGWYHHTHYLNVS